MRRSSARLIRILKLLNLLSTGRGFNANELAYECSVSRRTIFRDLTVIRDSGIPVHHDRSALKYKVATDSSLVRTQLDCDELMALGVACEFSLLPRQLSSAARHALLKLLKVRPLTVQLEIERLLDACWTSQNRPWNRCSDEKKIIPILNAIQKRRCLRLIYTECETNAPVQIKFSPYQLKAGPTGWQAVGRSSWHRKRVTLFVERIRRIEVIDEQYQPCARNR